MDLMPSYKRETGNGAESFVTRYLDALGYHILTTNYSVPRLGEIDIIARRGKEVYFVEVKARSNDNPFGGMEGCISADKLHRIRQCADIYLQHGPYRDSCCRIVGAFVHITQDKKYEKIRLVPLD